MANPSRDEYLHSLQQFGMFASIQEFWQSWCEMLQLFDPFRQGSSVHVFRQGVSPTWEDPANCNGGKFSFGLKNLRPEEVRHTWFALVIAMMFGLIDEEISGVILHVRDWGCQFSVWNSRRLTPVEIQAVTSRLCCLIGKPRLPVKFNYHDHAAAPASPVGPVPAPAAAPSTPAAAPVRSGHSEAPAPTLPFVKIDISSSGGHYKNAAFVSSLKALGNHAVVSPRFTASAAHHAAALLSHPAPRMGASTSTAAEEQRQQSQPAPAAEAQRPPPAAWSSVRSLIVVASSAVAMSALYLLRP
eukprot:TRINITY_DN701_c0_g1_i19.p2 TRINITY_DN701_c0_g1~~TRINITY_DN701_c0_g1_i19.p2  ORF type:complete len:300 (-),score=64.32 TRINITY_DN701_c0_g1_i19:1340-2239(-)